MATREDDLISRLDRRLNPESPAEMAALLGASMTPGVGTAIDLADLGLAVKNREAMRGGLALLGLLPFVSGATIRVGGKAMADAAKRGLGSLSDDAPSRILGQVDTGMSGKWFSRLESAIERGSGKATGREWRDYLYRQEDVTPRPFGKRPKTLMPENHPRNDQRIPRQYETRAREFSRTESEWTDIDQELEDRMFGGFEDAGTPVLRKEEVLDMARERPIGLSEEVLGGEFPTVGHEWRQAPFRLNTVDEWGLDARSNAKEIRIKLDGSDYVPNQTHKTPAGEIVRIRTTDRQINGDNTLFIEEIQSDWHQKGREEGYSSLEEGFRVINRSYDHSRYEFYETDVSRLYPTKAEAESAAAEFTALYPDQSPVVRRGTNPWEEGVPGAPFQKTGEWVGLALRRSLQEAVQGGYDRMAWINGEQAADLYDLRKQVSRIEYDEGEGALRVIGHDGDDLINQTGVTPDQLEGHIGKDPAQRLMEQEPRNPSWAPEGYVQARSIEGDDLAVGGEGMDEFYNSIVPKALQKEIKALGLKIEPVTMNTPPRQSAVAVADPIHVSLIDEFATSTPATASLNTEPTNLSIRITPEARERVLTDGMKIAGIAGLLGIGATRERETSRR